MADAETPAGETAASEAGAPESAPSAPAEGQSGAAAPQAAGTPQARPSGGSAGAQTKAPQARPRPPARRDGPRPSSRGGRRDDRRRGGGRGGRRKRPKVCKFCVGRGAVIIDYKNTGVLRQFLDDRSRIRKARQTGTCRKHQRKLTRAIKRAREMALVHYTTD